MVFVMISLDFQWNLVSSLFKKCVKENLSKKQLTAQYNFPKDVYLYLMAFVFLINRLNLHVMGNVMYETIHTCRSCAECTCSLYNRISIWYMNVIDRILAVVVCNKLCSKAVTMFSYFDRLQHYVNELAVYVAGWYNFTTHPSVATASSHCNSPFT